MIANSQLESLYLQLSNDIWVEPQMKFKLRKCQNRSSKSYSRPRDFMTSTRGSKESQGFWEQIKKWQPQIILVRMIEKSFRAVTLKI